MVRKWLLPLLAAALLLLPACALADRQVIDNANIIDPATEQQIIEVIEQIEREHQVDLVVLTTYDVPDDDSESCWRIRNYADDFYVSNGYGMGDDVSGMLYMIDMNNRVPYITTGGVMIAYMNDYRIEALHEVGDYYLQRGEYGKAVLAVMEKTGEFMDEGRMKGSFIYDEATGKRLSGIYNPLEPFEILLAAAAGIAVAFGVFYAVKGSYTLSGTTYSYDLARNSTREMLRDDEVFVRESVHRVRRPTGNDNSGGSHSGGKGSGGLGSATHVSSGGVRVGGGAGRRF